LKTSFIALLACAALPGILAGCGEEPDGAGAAAPGEVGGSVAGTAASMHGDMVTPADNGVTTVEGALGGGGSSHEPKLFYIRYADGTEQHTQNYDACTGTVPRFECSFAPTLVECQRQIQAYLDEWYKDFNIVFTLTRPTSGNYYTEVVSSGDGRWCKVSDKVAGVAPFLCKDLAGGVAYTFQGGRSARETAVIIAQEQAHLVGLEHTSNPHDLMYPTICTDCAGFVDADSGVTGDTCDRDQQNSYKMMKKALGDWPGGPKPSPFGCMEDTQDPSVRFVSPADGASMGHDFSVSVDVRDDCDVKKVEIQVMPQALSAVSMAPPYAWDLTGINGAQTITVTATDGSGRTGHATLQVTAPESREELGPGQAGDGAGCTVASGAFGATGLVPSLAMMLLFSRRNRRSRLRRVEGVLSEGR
jgi:hypothetical protein